MSKLLPRHAEDLPRKTRKTRTAGIARDGVGRSPHRSPKQSATAIPERLASAMQMIMGCWRKIDEQEQRPASMMASDACDLAARVRDYIALQADWETREAVLLARWMTEQCKGGEVAVAAAPAGIEPAPAAPAARQRALLVDDSADILILVGAFLEDFGFEVVHASSAEAALSILANDAAIDLIVTDHAMPGMTGKDLIVQAREQDPLLQALIISGYCGCDDLAVLPPGVSLLAKPFRRTELYARIFPARPMELARALQEKAGSY